MSLLFRQEKQTRRNFPHAPTTATPTHLLLRPVCFAFPPVTMEELSVFFPKANSLAKDQIPFLLTSLRTLLRQFLPFLLDYSKSKLTDAKIFPILGGKKT